MAVSTNPLVAAIPAEELFADGCCEGVEAARDFSGLSCNELYALMDARGVIPWMWRDPADTRRVRLIPRRALSVYLQWLYESQPNPRKQARPGASVRTSA